MQNQFLSLIHYVTVVPTLYNFSPIKYLKDTLGWDIPKHMISVQEEAMIFYSMISDKMSVKVKDPINFININTIVDSAIPSEKAVEGGVPEDRWHFGSHVCVVCIEYMDNNGEYELSQIGAVMTRAKSFRSGEDKLTYFATVLPSRAVSDTNMMADLGLSRNEVTGKVEYHNLAKMTSFEVVSEIQALMDLFEFLKANNCRDSILVTYSSYTTLPVILQLVDRHGLENMFYQMFSAFSDIQNILDELHPNNDFFAPGVPPFQDLASELCGDLQFIARPSAVDSALEILTFLFRIIEEASSAEGREINKLVKKCSENVSSLRYSEGFYQEMFPNSDQFIWPKESKLVEFKMTFNDKEVDFSNLIFILHNQVHILVYTSIKTISYPKLLAA